MLPKMNTTIKKWLGFAQSPFFNRKTLTRDSSFRTSRLFQPPIHSQPASSQLDNPLTIEDGSDNSLRRQLVQVLLRDVLRRHGIAMNLIDCQMLVVSSRSRGPGMFVRLVVRQWDEGILRYAFAFQNALLAELLRFDSKAESWLHGISWQLDLVDCPFAQMPEKSFWNKPAVLAVKTENFQEAMPLAMKLPTPQPNPLPIPLAKPLSNQSQESSDQNAEALKDLEQLFFIRDQEMLRFSKDSNRQYEKTEPSPL